MTVFFARQKHFSFKRSLLIVGLHACAKLLIKKTFPIPMCLSLFPTFSSVKFMASDIILRSLIYLQLSLAQDDRYESIFMETCMHMNSMLKKIQPQDVRIPLEEQPFILRHPSIS